MSVNDVAIYEALTAIKKIPGSKPELYYDTDGQLVIYTGLREDEDGELVAFNA